MIRILVAASFTLLLGAAHAQTVNSPALPSLAPIPVPVGMSNPNCNGPSLVMNPPLMYEGRMPNGAKITVARCLQVDGGYAWWGRERALGDEGVNAPIVWLTDTAPRGTPVVLPSPGTSPQAYAVVPGTAADKSRPSYKVIQGSTGLSLGKIDGGRAAANVACACDMIAVKQSSNTYCSYAPTPTLASVALCKPVSGTAANTASHHQMQTARDPMLVPPPPLPAGTVRSAPRPPSAEDLKAAQPPVSGVK